MTFRERIADWISGGALTRERALCRFWANAYDREFRRHTGQIHSRSRLDHALHRIAAEEKPTSNATVKRMARIAREALE